MGFTVDLAALATLPPVLERRAEEVDATARYLRRYATIADTGPLAAANPLREAHQRVLPAVVTATGECAESLLNRAAAIRAAVRTYATADDSSRLGLDALAVGPTHHGRLPGTRDSGLGAGPQGSSAQGGDSEKGGSDGG